VRSWNLVLAAALLLGLVGRIIFTPRHAATHCDNLAHMKCLYCQGTLHKGIAPFSVDRHGYHSHWDALPAWVCNQCGEPLFEPAEVDRVQRAVVALDASQVIDAAPPNGAPLA
jgi:YgiT-type zinc finger domain-containing protein